MTDPGGLGRKFGNAALQRLVLGPRNVGRPLSRAVSLAGIGRNGRIIAEARIEAPAQRGEPRHAIRNKSVSERGLHQRARGLAMQRLVRHAPTLHVFIAVPDCCEPVLVGTLQACDVGERLLETGLAAACGRIGEARSRRREQSRQHDGEAESPAS
jgi:hypothetical protein